MSVVVGVILLFCDLEEGFKLAFQHWSTTYD